MSRSDFAADVLVASAFPGVFGSVAGARRDFSAVRGRSVGRSPAPSRTAADGGGAGSTAGVAGSGAGAMTGVTTATEGRASTASALRVARVAHHAAPPRRTPRRTPLASADDLRHDTVLVTACTGVATS